MFLEVVVLGQEVFPPPFCYNLFLERDIKLPLPAASIIFCASTAICEVLG